MEYDVWVLSSLVTLLVIWFLMDFVITNFGILYLIVSNRIKASKQKDLNTQNDHL